MEFNIERQTKAFMVMMAIFEGLTVAEIISCLCAFIEALAISSESDPKLIARKIMNAVEKHSRAQQS